MKSFKPMAPMKPMEPMAPMSFGEPWWPKHMGEPVSSGAQDGMRYAFFVNKRRLLIEQDGQLCTYDSGDHRISGVAQQSGDRLPSFTSQDGAVRLDQLRPVD